MRTRHETTEGPVEFDPSTKAGILLRMPDPVRDIHNTYVTNYLDLKEWQQELDELLHSASAMKASDMTVSCYGWEEIGRLWMGNIKMMNYVKQQIKSLRRSYSEKV